MKKTLVVAEEQDTRFLYKKELEADGYSVAVATTCEEALQTINSQAPDLIILDIKKPETDGIELMSKVKDEKGDIPIIICTPQGPYKQDFRIWASDAYVVNSVDIREIKLSTKEIFNQRKAG